MIKSEQTLVIHTGGIGDLILAVPALACLSKEGPLELAGYKDRLQLLVASGLAQEAHSLDTIGFGSVYSEPSERLRDFLTRFQRVIVWMNDDGTILHSLEECGVSDLEIFAGLPPTDWSEHASQYYLRCLGYEDEGVPSLELETSESGRHDVIIHPGSGGRSKNWPLKNFHEVSSKLIELGHSVEWCIGPGEEEISLNEEQSLLCIYTLVELGQILASANLYIGNDSGITHLAAAVGCPTIGIFGPTDPQVWGPKGVHARIFHHSTWPKPAEILGSIVSHSGTICSGILNS